jgi:hypothetical protein
MTNYFRKPDALVDAVKAVLSGQPVQEKMDPVDQKALKGKHSDRKDKDIDNDGDVDSSDEYLHKRRKAVSKAMKEGVEDNPANTQHLCAKNVVHESWGEGSCIPTMHADPDEEGNVAWYDVMFDHGIEEQVSIEELKVTKAESHMHSSKKKIKESKDEYEEVELEEAAPFKTKEDAVKYAKEKVKAHRDKLDGIEIHAHSGGFDVNHTSNSSGRNSLQKIGAKHVGTIYKEEVEKNGKKKKVSGKKDDVDVEPEMDDTKMVNEKEMTPAQEKKREEIVLSMKKKMPDFKKKYGDRAKDVMYATATKMAMKEGFELGIEKSDLIEEVELDEDASNFKSAVARINKAKSVKDLHGLEKSFERIYKQTDAFTVKEFGKLDSMIVDKLVKLDEAKSGTGYDLYHKDFSSAMQHAYDHAKKKHGITINPKEIDDKVATGPAKPKEGKTNSYRLKGDKGAIQVQVYNKGGSKPFELNMYKEEVELDEGRGRPRKDGTKSDTDDREQIQMQLRKSVSLRGLKDVEFDDGKKVKVSARDARDVLGKLDAIKAPRERQNAVVHIAKSYKNLVDFAKGKAGEMDPEQRRKDAANSPFKKK